MKKQDLVWLVQQQMSADETSLQEAEQGFSFRDFRSFSELEQQPVVLGSLIKCYQDIFSEPDIWNEFYTEQEIATKLRLELAGHCSIRVCVNVESGCVVGFCWAQSLTIEKIGHCIESVKYIGGATFQGVKDYLELVLNGTTAVYLHDLGIAKNYRQTISLERLLVPPIAAVAMQSSDQQLVFWSVAETCIAHVAQSVEIAPFYQQDNLLFFCGSLAK